MVRMLKHKWPIVRVQPLVYMPIYTITWTSQGMDSGPPPLYW
ncbi:uncharacterized protein G2W53_012637 [Senna tora]|uniref:Uncharacterized protein n=1 Tax=Senna tora TaxID=362788 RepID=A0A834TYE7_9FABA|nr:uncharacterized protein G2W53_012637 [Senna tora]